MDSGNPATDPETLDSLALIRRAQGGDLPAYERLFERYYNRVKGVVRARLGPELRRSLDSGDILNDAMVAAIRGFEDYEIQDAGRFMAWFGQIVENRIRSAHRYQRAEKRDRDREVALDHINASMSSGRLRLEPTDPSPSPSSELARREESEVARQCLAELPETSREVIRLRHDGERTWEAIAEELGLSSSSAARRLYARAKVELSTAVRERLGRD